MALRERILATGSFYNRWHFNRREALLRRRETLDEFEHSFENDPDSEVRAHRLFKGRRQYDVAHQSLTRDFHKKEMMFEEKQYFAREDWDRDLLKTREYLYAQPVKLQTRRGIVQADALGRFLERETNLLTNQIALKEQAGASAAVIDELKRRRQHNLDLEQNAFDQLKQEILLSERAYQFR